MEKIIKDIVKWIQDQVKSANANGVIVGISGGIDSAVVAHLAKMSFPDNSLGVLMDIGTSTNSRRNALRVINDTKIESKKLNFDNVFEELKKAMELDGNHENEKLISGNLKSRLRMSTLYALAQERKYLVLGTSNLSEITIGYFTKWGDGAADIYPIADFTKKQVYELASELGVNERVIGAKPSADLWEGQTDEDEMGFTYNDLDDFINDKKLDDSIKKKIETLNKINNHKIIKLNKFNIK